MFFSLQIEKQIEVQKRSFTLQQIIDGTKNFSSKMEIGRGRLGVVYKVTLTANQLIFEVVMKQLYLIF